MKIERFDADDSSRGMREISAKYGDNVLIIGSSRSAGKIQFVIAIDTALHSPKLISPESLVKDFNGSVDLAAKPIISPKIPDQSASHDVAAVMKAGFDDIKVQLDELRHLQLKPVRRAVKGVPDEHEMPLIRLMRLFSGSTVPINLLQSLAVVTAGCHDERACIATIRLWLSEKLHDAPPLDAQNKVHFLVGGHGVGKTVNGIRLAATLRNSHKEHAARFVSYKLAHQNALPGIQIIGQRAGINTLHAQDFSELVTLINENIGQASLVIELPSNLHASELLRLQQRLPSALFHLVIATDSHANELHYVTRDGRLNFYSALITRLDYQSVQWPLLHALILNDVPLMLGSHSSNVGHTLVEIDKVSIIDDVVRVISDKLEKSDGSEERGVFKTLHTLSTNLTTAEMM